MSTRAIFYKSRQRKESRDVRSDFSATRYADTNEYDGIEILTPHSSEPHFYFRNRKGKWTGAWDEDDWLYEYMKVRKDFSTSEVGEHE